LFPDVTGAQFRSPLKIREICKKLSRVYSDPRLHNKRDPLDELIFIILSSRTSELSYLKTYRALRKRFRPWSKILETPKGLVAATIKFGGLSKKKETQIRSLLCELRNRGDESLVTLSAKVTKDAEGFLTLLPGVGLKTARCVLMYSLDRNVFPVDTHVKRVLSRIGIIEAERLTAEVQDSIQKAIPPHLRYKLHVNLVAHGRAICRPRKPLCGSCVVKEMCSYYSSGSGLSGNSLLHTS